jgi:hypothetical protein
MKKLRKAMAECFEWTAEHGTTSHLMWDRLENKWFVGVLIIPCVKRRYDIIKTFKA